MIWRQREPTLKEILSDSIVTALMAADGVDPHELEAMLQKIGRTSNASGTALGRLVVSAGPESDGGGRAGGTNACAGTHYPEHRGGAINAG